MAKEVFQVFAGRADDVLRKWDAESGEHYSVTVPCHRISFRTRHGHEYTHLHQFPNTPDGLHRAQRLAERVTTKLNAEGVDALQDDQWGVRTIYGTSAYLVEESDIVQREKDDALLNEGCG